MNVINRAKNMILTPKTEWDVVAAETTPPAQLATGYVLPLAAAYALASFIGSALIFGLLGSAFGAGGLGVGMALIYAIYALIMAVISVFVLAFIIDALAPTFAGQKNFNQALKVAAYSYTPIWVFGLLTIIPVLGWLAVLVGVVYALYLLWLGLPRLMQSPQDKAVPYVVVVIVCAIVLAIIINVIGAAVTGMGRMGRGFGSTVSVDSDARVAKLNEFARKMEDANRRMEAAQKSGDGKQQAELALAALGTAISGGQGVDPVSIDKLKPFVPETVGGLPRTDLRTERSGVKGLMVAKAEATYGNGDRNVGLEITDTGGAAGLMGLASWVGVQGERENSDRREATRKEGTRLVHEEQDKHGGSNRYMVVLSDRFIVTAEGNGVDLPTLKSAVHGLNLAALESLK